MSNILAQQLIPFAVNSAASTNGQLVKTGPIRLMTLVATNVNAAARFVKLYDKATAPVVGTDIPFLTVPVPANGAQPINFGALGHQLLNGLALAITGAGTDADTTAVAAGDVKVSGDYL